MFCCIWTGTLSFSLYRHTNLFYVYCTHGKCSCTLIHYSDRVSPWPSCEWDSDGTTWLKQKQNDNKCSYSIIGCLTVTIWSRETETFLIKDWWTEAEVLKRPEKSMSSHRSKVVTASMQTHGCMQTLVCFNSILQVTWVWSSNLTFSKCGIIRAAFFSVSQYSYSNIRTSEKGCLTYGLCLATNQSVH